MDDQTLRHIVSEREGKVNNHLHMNQTQQALYESLRGPPCAAQDDSIKQQAAAIVSNVISQVKSSDIKGHVDSLEPHDLDTLMMYVYKGLAAGENSTALLQWHAAIVTKGGLGCIVRVLSARKSVL